jgi:hypothetical protein
MHVRLRRVKDSRQLQAVPLALLQYMALSCLHARWRFFTILLLELLQMLAIPVSHD